MRSRLLAATTAALFVASSISADSTSQALPFSQDWTNIGLITTNDIWTGVPGILGCRGDGLTSVNDVDARTVLAADDCAVVDVNANQTNPATFTTGGVTEFHLADPVIALTGSGTADAPYILLHLNTTAAPRVRVRYKLRDLDASVDNAVQQIALQYRIGSSGDFTNVPSAYVADATTGPSLATQVTNVDVTLPAEVNNQPLVQLRILTTNAGGNDEWVGIDDILIDDSIGPIPPAGTGTASPSSVEATGSTLLTVAVTPGANPVSTGLTVTGNLTAIGGSATQAFFDDGTNGDATAADSTFSYQAAIPLATPLGLKSLAVAIADAQLRSSTASIAVTITAIPVTLSIPQIQGAGTESSYDGQFVRTTGIVTARVSNGFFVQDPSPDGDPATSEGLFVFTQSTPPAAAVAGNQVQVTGTVDEFRRGTYLPSVTELTSPFVFTLSTGNGLPSPVPISAADVTAGGGLNQLERLEGMRVSAASLTVTSPTSGFKTESAATSVSDGFFYAVFTGTARPFREPGILIGDPDPNPAPGIPRFDSNPELLGVDSNAQSTSTAIDVTSGAVVTGVAGVLHQDFGEYRVFTDATPSFTGNISATPVPAALATELKVASFNLERFYDNVDDPGGDVALTAPGFARRLKKASLAIRNVLSAPDVVAVIEMENLAALNALAAQINADAVAAGQPNPGYATCLVEGNDIGGIDNGFLYQTPKVTLVDCVQFGKTDTFIDPSDGSVDILHDRPPLVLRGSVTAPGSDSAYSFTVVANHLRSLNDVDDPGNTGLRVRAKRRAQAEYTATLLNGRQSEHTISVGDYNAFQFNDGYVDVMGTIRGVPTPAGQVTLASPDLVEPNYTNLVDTVSLAAGYSYVFAGSAQSLDHALVNSRVLPRVTRYTVARLDADFPEAYRSDDTRPERISDHDAPVIYLALPVEITSLTALKKTPLNFNTGQQQYMGNLQVKNTSASPLPNPFYVVFDGLDPSVTLLNASGVTPDGWPYITVNRTLQPTDAEVVQLRFTSPGAAISYTPKVFKSL